MHAPALVSLIVLILVAASHRAQSECSFVTDGTARPVTSMSKPGYLQPYTDPAFGMRVVRVAGNPGSSIPTVGGIWPTIARHHYSKTQPWNADMSLLYLNRQSGFSLFVDGKTYEPLLSGAPPSSYAKWDPSNASRMIYVKENAVGYYTPTTNASTTIKTFSGYSNCGLGCPEGEAMEAQVSNDGKRLVVVGTRNSDNALVGFVYDIAADKKYSDFTVNDYDHQSMSPLGDYVVQHNDGRATLLDLNGKQLANSGSPQCKHQDVVLDSDGKQYICGVNRDSSPFGRVCRKGPFPSLTAVNITSFGNALHTSGRAIDKPGWVVVGMSQENGGTAAYADEILMIKLDGSEVRRLAQARGTRTEYLAEHHAVPSPDGSRVVFATNWHESGSIQAYVIELCQDPPSGLAYSENPASYEKGIPIKDNVPTVTGTVDSFTIDPALPAGLALDRTTGVISGAPSEGAAETEYMVTAWNRGGSCTVVLTMSVAADATGLRREAFGDGHLPHGTLDISVYALDGKLVVRFRGEPEALRRLVVPSGTYLVSIRGAGISTIRRMVVRRAGR